MPLPALIPAILPIVAEFAPDLIRHFAGKKAGEVAETVTQVAAKITGVAIDPARPGTADEVVEELRENPYMAAELRTELTTRLAEIDLETERAYLEDRQDARERTETLEALGAGSARPNVMLALAFASIIAIAALICLVPGIPQEVVGFLTAIGGMFARNIGSAFDFEFGSSRGSKEKDAALAALASSASRR